LLHATTPYVAWAAHYEDYIIFAVHRTAEIYHLDTVLREDEVNKAMSIVRDDQRFTKYFSAEEIMGSEPEMVQEAVDLVTFHYRHVFPSLSQNNQQAN
jgi:Cu2+-containing amine oxidase